MQETAVNRIVALLLAQQKGEVTANEQEELDAWIGASEANRQFADRCLDQQGLAASLEQLNVIDEAAAWRLFMEKSGLTLAPVIPLRRRPWRWIAAAITIGLVATSAYLYFAKDSKKTDNQVVTTRKGEDIKPGTNKATLTLGDGSRIVLDDKKDGTVAKEEGSAIDKKGDALVYSPHKEKKTAGKAIPVIYNTLATPRGGYYELTLPDNSKVWLNAEASIRFPTAFNGNERRVEVTGELYFEVAKNASKPFIVTTGEAQIKVLGTHFNIRNYPEEGKIKTTLLEGSVEVAAIQEDKKVVLKPAQQAAVIVPMGKPAAIRVEAVDVEEAIAWKNGYFAFRDAALEDIMKEVKRWYGEVGAIVIKTPVTDRFTATIPRNVSLATLLRILEETDRVHFEVKDKTIIVNQ